MVVCRCIYGGAPKGPQVRDLRSGVEIVIATPGMQRWSSATCTEAEAADPEAVVVWKILDSQSPGSRAWTCAQLTGGAPSTAAFSRLFWECRASD